MTADLRKVRGTNCNFWKTKGLANIASPGKAELKFIPPVFPNAALPSYNWNDT